ncbi:HDL260Wp [Eremothecium sinecaudum]|uniref:HDL260Wp n=1 Tax=Eremothecium sinecaudum TaxID=45286 RepID=A0A0X8HS83_9SACH|nr:HDL260Wp [Eremothecium sinecaudum]AMD20484.1 HDL260Wp [Eremothecium sinecaudum]
MYTSCIGNENRNLEISIKSNTTAGQPSTMVNYGTHRVALSDVTSQVNNRHNRGSSLYKHEGGFERKSLIASSHPSVSSVQSLIQHSDSTDAFRDRKDVDDDDVYFRDGCIGIEGDDVEGRAKMGDVNEDTEGVEPLLPIINDEICDFVQQITEQLQRENPDPLDEDTWDAVMVAEYAPEIFPYLRTLEGKYAPNSNYMQFQPELKWSYRATLIDWIVQVHGRFLLLPETLYLTMNIIDRFLSKKTVTLNRFQLVGAAALYIASKYEEINCPTLKEMLYMLDNAYTGEEVLKAERYMIDTLEFEFGWPGPMSFLRRVSKADNYEYDIRTLAKYLLETTIMEARLVAAPPSWLAAGAYYLSRIIIGYNTWTKKHIFYSGYTSEQLVPLATVILENCRNAEKSHQAIYEKYSKSRHRRSAQVVARWIAMAEENIQES